MKRRVLVLMLLFLIVGLVGCAKTKVSDVFRFEVRKLEMTLYADETKNLEKELGLVRGDIDPDAEIVFTMSYIDGENVGERCFVNNILEIIEVEPYVNDSGIIEGTIISDADQKVKIRAKGEGQIRLTAFLKDSPNVTDSIIVTVTKEVLSGLKVSAPDNAKILYVGQTLQLSVDTFPNHIETEYTFKSSNILVATVDKNGLVKGVGPNKTSGDSIEPLIITVTSKYDPSVFATYDLSIVYEKATGIELKANDKVLEENEEVKLIKGETLQLSSKVLSEMGFAQQNVTYKSSDTKVATVSSTGAVKAVEGGTAKITASSSDGFASFSFDVTVGYNPSTALDVKFENEEVGTDAINVALNKTYSFATTVTPVESGNQNVSITVADEAYADYVKIDGLKITPLKIGEFTLKVSTLDAENPIVKEVKFKVDYDTVAKVEITSKPVELVVGDEYNVVAKVSPSGAKQDVTYKSSDESIATVDSEGKVTAIKQGKVTISVTSAEDAEKIASIELNVYDKVTAFTVTGVADNQKLVIDEDYELTIVLTPETSFAKNIEVECDEDYIEASVDGLVITLKAIEIGTTKVKVIVDENLSVELNLEVVDVTE